MLLKQLPWITPLQRYWTRSSWLGHRVRWFKMSMQNMVNKIDLELFDSLTSWQTNNNVGHGIKCCVFTSMKWIIFQFSAAIPKMTGFPGQQNAPIWGRERSGGSKTRKGMSPFGNVVGHSNAQRQQRIALTGGWETSGDRLGMQWKITTLITY